MRHRKVSRKLSRRTGHRTATLKALVINLFTHQRIETTLAKAKEARSFAERLITMARKDNVAARRVVFARLRDKKIIGLLFKDIAPRFNGRPGGYTRIMRLGKARAGDGAEMAILELVEQKVKEPPKPKKEKKKGQAEKQPEPPKPPVAEEKPAEEKIKEEKPKEEEPKKEAPKKGFLSGIKDIFKKKE
jgi:large subunit ribosomal protein L17